jgi:hypothetical protein
MITAKSSEEAPCPYDIETCISASMSAESPPAGAASRSIAKSASRCLTMLPSHGPLTNSLRPASGIIEPPCDDHAAAIERAAEPPPLILSTDPEGSIPICLQAETKPRPSVLVPDQFDPDLLSWLIALTPSGPVTPSLACGECFSGAVHDSHNSPSKADTCDSNSAMLVASMKTCSACSIPRLVPTMENSMGVSEWEIEFPAIPQNAGLLMALARGYCR